jgi:hypothetical protein
VLSRYDKLSGMCLELRPSQEKFGSQHPALEVCSVASWLPAYLNRQVILMMQHNGVPTEVGGRCHCDMRLWMAGVYNIHSLSWINEIASVFTYIPVAAGWATELHIYLPPRCLVGWFVSM